MIPEGFKTLAKLAPIWKGDYDLKEFYLLLDIVFYEGSSFIAIKDYPEGPPKHDKKNWLMVASKGSSADVTGVKGQAEREYRIGNVDIHKEDIGLGNVWDLDPWGVLSFLTLEQIEEILKVKNLKGILENKIDKGTVVTGIRGEDETEFRKGDVVLSKADLGIPKVENYSLEEILSAVRQKVKAIELDGIENYKGDKTTIYASEEGSGRTLHLELMENGKEFTELFEEAQKLQSEEELDLFLKENFNSVVITSSLIKFLEEFYRKWLEVKFLEDFHPLVAIRGSHEEIWQSDRYVVTKQGIGLGNVPNENPDKMGAGYIYNTSTFTHGNEKEKLAVTKNTFILQPERIVTVKFSEDNKTFPLWLNVNQTGRRPITIHDKPVDKYNYRTFKRNGVYTFVYKNGSWNLISSTTKIKNERRVILKKNEWKGEQSPFFYFVEINGLYGDERIEISSTKITEEERASFILAGIEGESQSHKGFTLRAENLPLVDLPIVVEITR